MQGGWTSSGRRRVLAGLRDDVVGSSALAFDTQKPTSYQGFAPRLRGLAGHLCGVGDVLVRDALTALLDRPTEDRSIFRIDRPARPPGIGFIVGWLPGRKVAHHDETRRGLLGARRPGGVDAGGQVLLPEFD